MYEEINEYSKYVFVVDVVVVVDVDDDVDCIFVSSIFVIEIHKLLNKNQTGQRS